MGKAKRGKLSRGARHDPVGLQGPPAAASASGGGGAGPAGGAAKAERAHVLLQELKCPDRLRKEAAVVALAQLLEAGDADEDSRAANTASIRALIQKLVGGGAVQLLMERMFDTASAVRLHAAGALRNMAALEDADIARRMLKADVLTSVLGMLGKGPGEECTPPIAVQCLAAVGHLCEASAEAATAVARRGGLPLLLGALQYFKEWEGEGMAAEEAPGAAKGAMEEDEEDSGEEEGDSEDEGEGEGEGASSKKKKATAEAPSSSSPPPLTAAELRAEALAAACHALRAAVEGAGFLLVEQLASAPSRPLDALLGLLALDQEGEGASSPSLSLPVVARVHLAGAVAAVYLELKRVGFTDSKGRPFPSAPQPGALLSAVLAGGLAPGLVMDAGAFLGVTSATESVREAKAQRDELAKPLPRPQPQKGEGQEGAPVAVPFDPKDPAYQQAKRQRRWERKQARLRLEEAQRALAAAEARWEEGAAPLALALEALSDLVAGDAAAEEEEGDEGEEELMEEMEGGGYDSDREEGLMEAEAARLLSTQQQQEADASSSSSSSPLFSLLASTGVLPRLLAAAGGLGGCLLEAHAQMTAAASAAGGGNAAITLKAVPIPLVRHVLELRRRAVLALGTLVGAMPSPLLAAEAPALWPALKRLCRQAMEEEGVGHGPWYTREEEPWPGLVTGVMAQFLRRCPEALAAAEDEALLSSLLRQCPYFEGRANAAAMLGGLSQLQPARGGVDAATREARAEAAGALLRGALGEESHVMVLAAVLDALMDLFADDALHPAFQRLGLLPVLQEALPKFRLKCKTEAARCGRDAAACAREAALNTSRFVKYKAGFKG